MAKRPSASDLAEVRGGKGSARDRAEAAAARMPKTPTGKTKGAKKVKKPR